MIRTFLYLDVRPGERDALIAWYKENGALEKAVEYANCRSTEMYPLPDDPDKVLVTALWENPEDYQRWVDHPWRRSSSSGINQFLKEGLTPQSRGDMLHSLHAAPTSHQ